MQILLGQRFKEEQIVFQSQINIVTLLILIRKIIVTYSLLKKQSSIILELPSLQKCIIEVVVIILLPWKYIKMVPTLEKIDELGVKNTKMI
jgi:hypothetical protein|tara:strand:- start:477 stop:749 length:273 start_codon:yes stop_codon:yes gene_type:complete